MKSPASPWSPPRVRKVMQSGPSASPPPDHVTTHRRSRAWLRGVSVVIGMSLLARAAAATVLSGGGPRKSDCYVTVDMTGTTPATSPEELDCTEGDPSCDGDGACGNDSCTIQLQVCINQGNVPGCTPPASLKRLTSSKTAPAGPSSLVGSACGAPVDEVIPLKMRRGKPKPGMLRFRIAGKADGVRPPTDKDSFTFRCIPRPTTCPTTTTSTTLPDVCGDGIVGETEACDDGNTVGGDGCTACTVDPGFACIGEPSSCHRAPLLHYALDSDGMNSGSVAGYPLSLYGSVTFVTGQIGQAAQFATGSYGLVQGSARAVLGVHPTYTISLWVMTSVRASNAVLDFDNRYVAPYGGVQLYISDAQLFVCVATTSNRYLTGNCVSVAALDIGSWHNVIFRYAGTGTGAGQGADVDIYEDDVHVATIPNDASNDPVFSSGISDGLYLGTAGITLDDVRVYDHVFTVAEQCSEILAGTWNGQSCAIP